MTQPVLFLVMFNEKKESLSTNDLLKNSARYGESKVESEEIQKDKWHASGRVGHEVGFERALADWLIKHRSSWIKGRQPETQPSGL